MPIRIECFEVIKKNGHAYRSSKIEFVRECKNEDEVNGIRKILQETYQRESPPKGHEDAFTVSIMFTKTYLT